MNRAETLAIDNPARRAPQRWYEVPALRRLGGQLPAGVRVVEIGFGSRYRIRLARQTHPDLIVLDLRLPDVPGEDVAPEVRAVASTPILMLTAKTDAADRIHGLELGADDYVTKPFSPREVVLRVRAILRRAGDLGYRTGQPSYGHGRLVIDQPRHEAAVAGRPVELTATEWGLLTTLAGTPGRVFSRYELINRVREHRAIAATH